MTSEVSRSKRRSSRSADSSSKSSMKVDEHDVSKQKVVGDGKTVKTDDDSKHKNKPKQKRDSREAIEIKENIARKVIDFEEELSNSKDSLTDVREFQETCQSIEKIVTDINDLKKVEGNTQEELHTRRLDAMLLTTNLKKLNRLAQIRGNKAKENTQEVKKKVDLLHLDLQNLLYEVMHMKKEISKCMNFSSRDEEIDLISVDRFFEEAPADISKPEITKSDPHQQMLARLDYELKRRKELSLQKKECIEQKKKTEAELYQKTDYLANLRPNLDQIIKATLPVQEYMGLPIETERLLFEKAQYLPRPLYVLYIQAKAFKDVCDKNMDVDIEGDEEEAKAACTDGNVDSELSGDESETEKETEKENGGESDTRGRKAKKELKSVRLGVYQERVLKRHPLSVRVTLQRSDLYTISMKFYHIPALHISTVEVNLHNQDDSLHFSELLSSTILLNDLLSKDCGQQSPNTANKYQLEKLGMKEFSFYASTLGRPYYWVQWICGLNYLPNQDICSYTPNSGLSVKHFQSVVKTIRARICARMSLQKQLAQLEQLTIPFVEKRNSGGNTAKTVCTLSGWRGIYYDDILSYQSADQLTECGLISEDCMFYEAKLSREEALHAVVVVHTNYPNQAPIFLLKFEGENGSLNTGADILCLEREVNAYTEELLTCCDRKMILSRMLQKLQMCFDMFVETSSQSQTKEKLYTKKARGRDRNRPYVYHKDGYFVHR